MGDHRKDLQREMMMDEKQEQEIANEEAKKLIDHQMNSIKVITDLLFPSF